MADVRCVVRVVSEAHGSVTHAFQDYYPDHLAHCYGCGRLNPYGLRVQSYWADDASDDTVARLTPRAEQTAIPGFVYGGLIASLIDCHGTGTASAAAYRAEGRAMDTDPPLRFLTGTLHVEYLVPTPLGVELECRARIEEVKGRKVTVSARVLAGGTECARGRVIAIQVPDDVLRDLVKRSGAEPGGGAAPRGR